MVAQIRILPVVFGVLWLVPALAAQSLPLTQTTPEKLAHALRQICDHRVIVESPYHYIFTVSVNNVRRQCSLHIDPQTNRAHLTGQPELCEQVGQLIVAIDQRPSGGLGRQIITYQPHVPAEILVQAFDAYRRAQSQPNVAVRPLNPDLRQQDIRQVQYQVPAGGGPFDSPAVDSAMLNVQGLQPPGTLPIIGMPDDFRAFFLDQLDAVVIDADGARLRKFTEMIQQIEEISKLSRPKIEVVYLQHVNNVSLAGGAVGSIIQQIYNDVFATIPGAVRFIPMVSPNAVLLVGWGEALDTAKALLETLDQPTATEHSRLHIFKPRHISALQARNTLAGAFSPNVPPNSGFMARISLFHEARSNTLIIQAAPNDLAEAKRILEEIDVPDSAFTLQMKTKRLKNTLAPELKATLDAALTGNLPDGQVPAFELLIQGAEGQRLIKSGIMSNVKIDTDVQNNTLIIRGPESCLAFILELVELLDISAPEAVIKVFDIINADANSLVTMLTSLLPSNVEGLPGPQLPGTAGDKEDALIPLRFAVDRRTNCIVAAGSDSDLKVVEALLNTLDREDLLARQQNIYFLKNMKAIPVAETITSYIRQRLTLQSSSEGVIGPFQQLESAVIVVPDAESNSLIISAAPRYYDEVIKLIEEIDKSPPQVVIKVLIAEITLGNNKDWAAELGFQDPLLFLRGKMSPGLNFNTLDPLGNDPVRSGSVGTQLLSNFGAGRDGGGGGVVFSASSDYLSIMLRALHEKRRMEVLSDPQVITMNNQEATISVGQTVPRLKGTDMTQYGTREIVEDEDVALKLTVTPTISPEGTIVMNVNIEKKKLGAEIMVGTQRSTTVDTAELKTMISAANNETVVIGGLITKDENKTVRKVPLLGDIPYLGKLWRHESTKIERKELLVILTPRIVQTPEEREQVKQMEIARMSWCLSNVVETYGDIGAYNVVSEKPYTGDAPISTPEPVNAESLQPLESDFLFPVLPRQTGGPSR